MNFLEQLKGFFSKDLGWKAFSLLFAFCVWFVVINITNPKETWPFTIQLTLSGVENLAEYHNVVVKNQRELENTYVSVNIRGSRLSLETLNKYRTGLTASANLGVLYDFTLNGSVVAPIDISFPSIPGISASDFEITSISPKYANVILEEIITEEKTVKVTTPGEAAEGYVVLTPIAEPETVKLRGPRSKLAQIDSVAVEAPLSGETSDIHVQREPRLIDRDGNEVTDVDCFTEYIDISIQIVKLKKVPVFASYVGLPPEGYVVTGISWEPRELEIVGGEKEVNEFVSVRITPVNISGLTKTNTMSLDVRNMDLLPENVAIRNGTPNNVAVTVNIEQMLNKTLTIPVSLLSAVLSQRYSYNIEDTEIELTVTGLESAISALSDENVKLRVNLEGLEAGEHIVPVEATLPAGLSIAGEVPTVTVTIEENGSEPEDEAGGETPDGETAANEPENEAVNENEAENRNENESEAPE